MRDKQNDKTGAEGYFIVNDSLVCTGEDVICTSRMNQPAPWRINGAEVRGADPSLLKYAFEQPGTYFISQGNCIRQVKVTALQALFTAGIYRQSGIPLCTRNYTSIPYMGFWRRTAKNLAQHSC